MKTPNIPNYFTERLPDAHYLNDAKAIGDYSDNETIADNTEKQFDSINFRGYRGYRLNK